MYGESTWLSIPVSCFLVNFSVNNLYRIQYAVDTIPPADTPRTCVNGGEARVTSVEQHNTSYKGYCISYCV